MSVSELDGTITSSSRVGGSMRSRAMRAGAPGFPTRNEKRCAQFVHTNQRSAHLGRAALPARFAAIEDGGTSGHNLHRRRNATAVAHFILAAQQCLAVASSMKMGAATRDKDIGQVRPEAEGAGIGRQTVNAVLTEILHATRPVVLLHRIGLVRFVPFGWDSPGYLLRATIGAAGPSPPLHRSRKRL
jgi:hypothetical protein